MKNKIIYIHIGLHKSASSFLQQNYFPYLNENGIYYLNNEIIIKSFIQESRLFNKATIENGNYHKKIINIIEKSNYRKFIISCETFGGQPDLNFINRDYYIDFFKRLPYIIKIILVIRKQDDYCESAYSQALKFRSLNEFDYFNFKDGIFNDYCPFYRKRLNMDIKSCDWYLLIKELNIFFKKEEILILCYESLKKDDTFFYRKLNNFLEISDFYPDRNNSVNKRLSFLVLFLLKNLNILFFNNKNTYGILPQNFVSVLLSKIKMLFRNKKFYLRLYDMSLKIDLKFLVTLMVKNRFEIQRTLLKKNLKKKILSYHRKSNYRLSQEYIEEIAKYNYF